MEITVQLNSMNIWRETVAILRIQSKDKQEGKHQLSNQNLKSSCIKSEENNSPDQEIKHITPPNGSDNVYAVVDKTSKNVPTTNGGKGEGTCQPDQTYAVVKKTRNVNLVRMKQIKRSSK